MESENIKMYNPEVSPNSYCISCTLKKYEQAVALYATTDMSGKAIALECNVSLSGLRRHLRLYHRSFVLARYGITLENGESFETVKIHSRKGQSRISFFKYKDAIAACSDPAYIQYNYSEIARIFGHKPVALINQLKFHYPQVLEERELIRIRLGINDNTHKGALPQSTEQYAAAIEAYRTSEKNLPMIAEEFNISLKGLSQYLRFYHKELLNGKEARREYAKTHRKRGKLNGSDCLHEPNPVTIRKYEEALKLYRTTSLNFREIAEKAQVTVSGFRSYLYQWHRDLMLERRGIKYEGDNNEEIDLRQSKRRLKSTTEKYAQAIAELKAVLCPVAQVATKYGFHPETFRMYLKSHEPELAIRLGMTRLENGDLVSFQNKEIFAKAIHAYETTTDSLKNIATRLGLAYGPLEKYVWRHCQEARKRHRELCEVNVCPDSRMTGKYREALELYRDTTLSFQEIARRTHVCASSFRYYLRQWHPDLNPEQRTVDPVAVKYAPAIASLKALPRPITQVASEYGLAFKVFREYLCKHEPELVVRLRNKRNKKETSIETDNDTNNDTNTFIADMDAHQLSSGSSRTGYGFED